VSNARPQSPQAAGTDLSTLDIVGDDNAEVLVVDASGNETGFDPTTGNTQQNIPGSVYFRDQIDDDVTGGQATGITHSALISTPVAGVYQMTLTGINQSGFTLWVSPYSTDGSAQPPVPITGTIAPGSTLSYSLTYNPAPGSTVQVTSALPLAALSSTNLNLGNEAIGSSSSGSPVTLANNGGAALAVQSIATSANFGETDNCAGSVAAGGSCTIDVTISPTATGPLTGTLTITDNSNGVAGSTQTVSLRGTGTAPLASLSAPGFNFGVQPVGTTSPAQTETVTNNGTANLTISTVAIAGANASDFAISADACTGATVTPYGSCTIGVVFTPTASGPMKSLLSISDNAEGSPQTVILTGVGRAAILSVPGPASAARP